MVVGNVNCKNKCNKRRKKLRSCREGIKIVAEGFSHVPGAKSIEEEARIAVHPESNEGKRFLGDTGKVGAFWEETADKAIGIFVAAAFRGAVGMGGVVNGARIAGDAGSADSEGIRELATIIRGDGEEKGGEAFRAETSFDAVEDLNNVLTGFTAHKVDKLEASNAFSKDEESGVRPRGTDNAVHLEMTNLGTFIHFAGALLNTQGACIGVGETLTERFFAFFSWAINHMLSRDGNNAIVDVVVNGARREGDIIAGFEQQPGGKGGMFKLTAQKLGEACSKLMVASDF